MVPYFPLFFLIEKNKKMKNKTTTQTDPTTMIPDPPTSLKGASGWVTVEMDGHCGGWEGSSCRKHG